jgi:NAD(P)-dependent dehydrogenase (short-subunit alcohol dehydrogenase family)
MDEKLLKYMPMNRFGESNEIAEAILWLASDKTSFMTGQSIVIDGGSSL